MPIIDGFESLQDGMNGAVSPSLIGKTQMSKGVNLDMRNGRPRTRAAYIQYPFTGTATTIATLEKGRYQGGSLYKINGIDYFIFGVFGKIYAFHPETLLITDITPGDGLSPNVQRLYFCQANEYMIIQDGVSRPVILTGLSSRFSAGGDDPDVPEVPVGTAMAFGQGRLFVTTDKKYFMAGDIYLPWDGIRVLQFTETQYLAGGGAFGLPAWMGNIKAMAFQQNVVSGTGLGALVVFADRGTCSFAVQNPRSLWNTTDISKVLFKDGGGTGPASVLQVGSDIVYMAEDGIRSLKVTAGESQGGGATLQSVPLSRHVQSLVDDDTAWAYRYASGALHDNRLYFTSIARKHNVRNKYGNEVEDFYFNGVTTIDLLGLAGQPMVFEGVSTGIKFLQVFNVNRFGRENLCAFGLGANDEIGFYVQEPASYLDNRVSAVECRVYTGAMDFKIPTILLKKFSYADLWFSKLRGVVNVSLYYRAEEYELWTLAGQTQFIAKDNSDGNQNVYPQIRQKVRITESSLGLSDEDSELKNKLIGSKMQFCISWTGHGQLDRFIVAAEPQVDNPVMEANEGDSTYELTGSQLMDYDYVAA